MKISLKIILIAILLIVVFAVFRKDPLDHVSLPENLNEVVAPIEITSYKADFARCDETDNFAMTNGSGSTKLKVTEKTESDCLVEIIYESESGFYVNECQIPQELGLVEFNSASLDQISQYCQIKSTGTGLLELN